MCPAEGLGYLIHLPFYVPKKKKLKFRNKKLSKGKTNHNEFLIASIQVLPFNSFFQLHPGQRLSLQIRQIQIYRQPHETNEYISH